MSTLKVKLYTDPAHGWGAVKRQKLFELGIADKITSYSYQKGGTVYLEEDLDLGIFMKALKAKGVTIQFEEKYTDKRSPIRSYDSYRI